jgi:hypothetical protein
MGLPIPRNVAYKEKYIMSELDDIKELIGLVGVDDGTRDMTKAEVNKFLTASMRSGKLRRERDPAIIRRLARAHENGFLITYFFCKMTGTDPKTLSPKAYKAYVKTIKLNKSNKKELLRQRREWARK